MCTPKTISSFSPKIRIIIIKTSVIFFFIMFIIYSKERKNSSNTHTQHRNKLLIYTITLIYKYIHSRKKKHGINI